MNPKSATEAPRLDQEQIDELLHELLDEAPGEAPPRGNTAFCASGGKTPVCM
jgi:hypothetical protein